MAALDFPSSPTTGQIFSGAGVTWTWDGAKWIPQNTASSDTGRLIQITRTDIAAAVAIVDFTTGIDSTYDEYELHFFGVTMSAAAALNLRISQDGGSTWKAGASDYMFTFRVSYVTTASSIDNGSAGLSLIQIGPQQALAVATPIDGIIRFTRPASTTMRKYFRFETAGYHATAGYYASFGQGVYNPDLNAINGI